jgi:hypothetical protein
MSDAVKAAIEAAAQAVCRWPDGLSCNSSQPSPACENCTGHAAAAIAAFLRALPDWCLFQEFGKPPVPGTTGSGHITDLAAAVTRAAQEDKR